MKRKLLSGVLSLCLAVSAFPFSVSVGNVSAEADDYNAYSYSIPNRIEKLDRGLIASWTTGGIFLSWRLHENEDHRFGTAAENVSFAVYRGNTKIATVDKTTNYLDASGSKTDTYSVAPIVNGVEGAKCSAVAVKAYGDSKGSYTGAYFDIPLEKPADETVEYVHAYTDSDGNEITSATFSFAPADASCGDLDGDGEYEIVLKWTSSERDVGSPGDPAYSGTVRLAAYKLDGTKLWDNDICLGKNVYSSAHTLQFLVYDFDKDGKAEVICQTSLGSKDAKGVYVSHSADPITNSTIFDFTDEQNETADYRGYGRITTGEEFLTVFNGETGAAIDTIDLPTARGGSNGESFGDNFGNRSNRFLADVAYLDGENPYAVYWRGYYFGKNGQQRTSICGVGFDGERLNAKYRFDTLKGQPGYTSGNEKYVGNGNHNMTVADVDADGKDEFTAGALCMEVNDADALAPKWCTYLEHGDALHIGNYDPTHKGLEFFTVHEDSGTNTMSGQDIPLDYGMSVIDAATGEILFHEGAGSDTGRGIMANVGAGGYYQFWSSANAPRKAVGDNKFENVDVSGATVNFRIFWDGDLYDELLDGVKLTKWNGSGFDRLVLVTNTKFYAINGTKANPSLQADLFGDWREEIIFPRSDGEALRVFTTTIPTEYKMKSLMYDGVYRSGVAAQQTAYNQPPHIGFYAGEEMFAASAAQIIASTDKTEYKVGEPLDKSKITVKSADENGTPIEQLEEFSVDGYDANAVGEQTLTVTALRKSTTLQIKVVTDFIIENNTVVGYKGTDSSVIIPTMYNGKLVTAIKENALSGSGITNITIPLTVETIGENSIPANSTINCVEGSAAHQYAVKNDINAETIKNITDLIVNEQFAAEQAVSVRQGNTVVDQTINDILYHVGARSSGGDGQTGFSVNSGMLTAYAGRFSNGGRHAYMQLKNAPTITAYTDYVLSADISFPKPTVAGGDIQMTVTHESSPSQKDAGSEMSGDYIDVISAKSLSLEYDTVYNYSLLSENGEYYRIIRNSDNEIISFAKLGSSVDTSLSFISFYSLGTAPGNNASVAMTISNLQMYSCPTALGKAKIKVAYTVGIPISGAKVSIDGKEYTTDENGFAESELLPAGVYQFTVTESGKEYKGSVNILNDVNTALCEVSQENISIVRYDANGGTGAPSAQIKTSGTDLTLSSTVPTRTGYTFLGWATTQTATTAEYQPSGKYTANADLTLYAVWKANTYTVTYNANGGTGAPTSQIKTYGTDLTLSSTVPTRTGYTFLGWATSQTATAAQYQPSGKYTANADLTLYAVWVAKDIEISYVDGKIVVTGAKTLTTGTILIEALYNNGAFEKVNIYSVTALDEPIEVAGAGKNQTAKYMLWSGLDTMKPFAKAFKK